MKRGVATAMTLAALALPMVSANAETYRAFLTEAGHDHAVGVVALDRHYRMAIISTVPDRSRWLHTMVDEVNAEDTLHLDAPPPPGTPNFASVTAVISRDDPRFAAALRDHLQRYYDVTLR